MNEADLVGRAQAGDPDAWLVLVERHGQPVFRLAYLLTANADDAADVAQETMLRAFRYLHRFDRSQPLQPWLLRIARNLAYNRRRSIRRFMGALRRLQAEPPGPGVEADGTPHRLQEARQGEVLQALQKLDAKHREVIYSRYFLELNVAETAATLGVAEGTVKSRLARGLARLRTVLEQEHPELAEEFRA